MKNFILSILFLSSLIACKTDQKESYNKVEKDPIFQSADSIPHSQYVGSKKCAECHEDQFKDWQGSHHDMSMQNASRQTIIAPFNGEIFKSQDVKSIFFQKDGKFYANTEGRDGKNHDYEVIYTFGITPLQQYIVKFPNGHFQCLRTAYDVIKKEWFDLYPDFKVVHEEWLHWSRGGLNWNTMCADCHSTNVRKNYNEKDHSYDTTYSIINVSCEACHGPGKNHTDNVLKHGDTYVYDGKLKMVGLGSKELVDACARCHSRRENISLFHNQKGTFLDHYFPQLINDPIYHPDGQIRDEDYVYASFLQSKMYHNGVSCKDCHNPHSTKRKFDDNRLCLQCHDPKYDTTEHHKHSMSTESALCINCHMTGKYYMGNDFRRDHSFRIPRPDQSLAYNTPNACTGCHKDKDDQWAYDNFVKLYGEPKKNHFSDKLAPGIMGHEYGLDSLIALAHDTIFPNIARASAVDNIKNYGNIVNPKQVLAFLKDASPIVQGATADLMTQLEIGKTYYKELLPLLNNPKRAVRVKTFMAISGISSSKIPENYKASYNKVKVEFANHLKVTGEFSGGRMKRAQYYMNKGLTQKAIQTLEEAQKLDVINNIIRTTLANLYYQTGQTDKALKAYQKIIELEPGFGMTNFNYGLLLNELGKRKEAIEQLKLGHQYMPDNDRIVYNLALMQHQNNLNSEAIVILNQQLKKRENPDLMYLLAYIQQQLGNKAQAKKVAEKLIELVPNNPTYMQLYKTVE